MTIISNTRQHWVTIVDSQTFPSLFIFITSGIAKLLNKFINRSIPNGQVFLGGNEHLSPFVNQLNPGNEGGEGL
jgi:hypothetical protein